jgi:hypothetical protein
VYRGRTKSKKLEQALRSGVRSRYTDLKGATERWHSSCYWVFNRSGSLKCMGAGICRMLLRRWDRDEVVHSGLVFEALGPSLTRVSIQQRIR